MDNSNNIMVIYPYSDDFFPAINYSNMILSNYIIKDLISPKGWGLSNTKVFIDNTYYIEIKTNFFEINEDVNCIFIPEFYVDEYIEINIINNIIDFIKTENGQIQKIINSKKLNCENEKKLKNECMYYNIKYIVLDEELNNNTNDFVSHYDNNLSSEILNTNVPIIVISGLYENTDKFYSSLVIRDELIKNGYTVSQIGSKNFCEMMGFHSFPKFMNDSKIDEIKKVILFNRYINEIINNEKPDIIIITIPGSLQNLNEIYTVGFGILHYLIFKAISVDFFIICSFFDELNNNEEFYNIISKSCYYRFSTYVDCFHMSNLYIDFNFTKEKNELELYKLNRNYVSDVLDKKINNYKIPIIDLYQNKYKKFIYKKIIDKLS